jgi:thioredoxin 1
MSSTPYSETAPTRDEVDAMKGPVLLDFGTEWCGHCRAARPLVDATLGAHPEVRHLRIEDGPGRRLARSFGVKLWPTLVFMREGQELERLVRPREADAIERALASIAQAD